MHQSAARAWRGAARGPAAAPDGSRWVEVWAALAVIGCAVLAVAYAQARSPWWDEGLYADVAHQFAQHGALRSNLMGRIGTFGFDPLLGMDERAYWTTPLFPVVLGLVFEVTGTGLLPMRLLSLACVLTMIGGWWYVVRRLTDSRPTAFVAAALIALSSHVLWAASMGRPDSMAAALAALAMAAYLHWRERSLLGATTAAGALFAAAGLAHPMVLVQMLGFAAVALRLDFARLRTWHVLAAAAVGVVVLSPWLLYVLQDVETFRVQWGVNAEARKRGLEQPLHFLLTDVAHRYVNLHFTALHGLAKVRVLELFALGGCFALAIGGAVVRRVRRVRAPRELRSATAPAPAGPPGLAVLGLFAVVSWAALAVLDGVRWSQYFLHVFPGYLAVAAVVVHGLLGGTQRRRALGVALAAGLGLPGVGGLIQRVVQNPYRTEYLPAVATVERYQREGLVVIAPSEFGFELGFDGGFTDDMQMRSRADVYVQGELYLTDNEGEWQRRVRGELRADFVTVLANRRFRVFVRRGVTPLTDPASPGLTRPLPSEQPSSAAPAAPAPAVSSATPLAAQAAAPASSSTPRPITDAGWSRER